MLSRSRGFAFLVFVVALVLALAGCQGDVDTADGAGAALAGPSARDAAAKLEEALEKKDRADARFGRALGRVGAMLTAEQTRQFARAFDDLPDVAAASADWRERSSTLAAVLDGILADDEALASVMRGERTTVRKGRTQSVTFYGPRDLYEAEKLLASSPSGTSALAFAARLLGHDEKLAAIDVDDSAVVDEILVPALPSSVLETLLRTGSAEQALEQTKETLSLARDQCKELRRWLDPRARSYAAGIVAVAPTDTIAVAGRDMGAALNAVAGIISIWELGVDLSTGDRQAAVQTLATHGPATVTGLADATRLIRRALLGAQETVLLDRVVTVAGRISAGVGVVVGVFKVLEDSKQWSLGTGEKLQVMADVVAVAGAALMIVSTGPVGPVLVTLAVGIDFIADWFKERALEQQEKADVEACLAATNVSSSLQAVMLDADPTLVRTLTREVGLSAENLQWLMTVDDWAVSSRPQGVVVRYVGLLVAKDIFALDGTTTTDLLRAVVGDEEQADRRRYRVDTFLRGLEYGAGWTSELSKPQALAWLEDTAASSLAPKDPAARDAWAAAFRNGKAYLATR